MYIVVTDRDSKVVLCTDVWAEAVKFANTVRRCAGEVSIFKLTKG